MFTESDKPTKIPKSSLTLAERKSLKKIIYGDTSSGSKKAQELLSKPHVAICFESILDSHGLSDDQLAKKISSIIGRKEVVSINPKNGTTSSNISQVDANTLQAIRMVWQLKGKFTEKMEVKSELSNVPDSQLDSMIGTGMTFLTKQKNRLHDDEGSTN